MFIWQEDEVVGVNTVNPATRQFIVPVRTNAVAPMRGCPVLSVDKIHGIFGRLRKQPWLRRVCEPFAVFSMKKNGPHTFVFEIAQKNINLRRVPFSCHNFTWIFGNFRCDRRTFPYSRRRNTFLPLPPLFRERLNWNRLGKLRDTELVLSRHPTYKIEHFVVFFVRQSYL